MRAVLDTNVLVSALVWGGPPALLVDEAACGKFRCLSSPPLLEELRSVLDRGFLASTDDRADALRIVRSVAEVVDPSPDPPGIPVRDPGDLKVIACAIAGKADVIVTGDKDLLVLWEVAGIRVVTVRRFLEFLGG